MKLALTKLFALTAALNVISCAMNRQLPRRITKAMLMPLLIGIYLTSSSGVSLLVVSALFCGWLGDIFLIKPGNEKLFALGLGSFAVGHILYIIAILRGFAIRPPIAGAVIMALFFYAAVLYLYRMLRPKLGDIKVPALCYVLLLSTTASLASFAFFTGNPGGLQLYLGGVCFLISDGVLAVQNFTVGDPAPKYDFTVMLTYIAAQSLLTWAFCF